ncbi:Response regulator receiver domain-containing protein [Thalassotalea agarivorans]|uniref:Response regulator receiver domain-containing protein n=1 Tax=Thalassotalea agarivorans TaxID=349064 RepID=A0A1I0D6F7_THASX|nr:Response regulator receiver domain-containing protein [Thalassotalea agarivorans]
MIKVLLVDDHELVRTGIRRILQDVKGFSVIGEVCSGEEAVQFCRKEEPDVVLMDIQMPGIGGLEATKRIIRYSPDVKIIVLTVHSEDPIPTKVMQIGAAGYLTKSAGPEEMINAVRAVNAT